MPENVATHEVYEPAGGVAFLGPIGSYSQDAAVSYFGKGIKFHPTASFAEIFMAVQQGLRGIVPTENSIHGSVVQSLDLIRDCESAIVSGELYLPIHHCFVSRAAPVNVKTLVSHPQALGQCKRYIQSEFSDANILEVASTSLAAKMASSDPSLGAICSETAASIYGVPILQNDIEDDPRNTTRFFALHLSVVQSLLPDSPAQKTLLLFTVPHREPGALCDALEVFKKNRLNLTSIQSRPSKDGPWQYVFFVEFSGHVTEKGVQFALGLLKSICLEVRVVGSFQDRRSH